MDIKGILNNGEWIEDPVHVKDVFLCHFSTRFQQPARIPPSLDTDSFTPLSSSQCEYLEHQISRYEIKRAVWDCGGDRKIFANRLCTVIGSCISSVQSAFIQGRNILDGPLILNEVLSWYRDRKKELMVFKVDFEKAFDSLRWDFLDLVMEKLGFGLKWRSWINGCCSDTTCESQTE
ncbi:RNA-directed DNA polymerase, eukaryota, reverse transcriptase zinc-binding domain protein [Tanacetum coccineum]